MSGVLKECMSGVDKERSYRCIEVFDFPLLELGLGLVHTHPHLDLEGGEHKELAVGDHLGDRGVGG